MLCLNMKNDDVDRNIDGLNLWKCLIDENVDDGNIRIMYELLYAMRTFFYFFLVLWFSSIIVLYIFIFNWIAT